MSRLRPMEELGGASAAHDIREDADGVVVTPAEEVEEAAEEQELPPDGDSEDDESEEDEDSDDEEDEESEESDADEDEDDEE